VYLCGEKRRGRACEPGEIGIREAVGVHRQHGVSSDGLALETLRLVLPPGGALKHALDLHSLSPRSLPIRSAGHAFDASRHPDLLVVTVLLFKDVLHFLLHKLNAKPDAVDSRRHAVHLAVEAPKVVQNLVVLLDGLELHGLHRTSLVSYRKCRRAQRGTNLQADVHQVDEPAQLFDDLVALLGKLGGPDDLPTPNGAPTASTTKRNVRTCPSRPFSSYSPTQSKSTAVSFVMSSITVCCFSSAPANLEPEGLGAC
jgi:hypothetical protein